MRGSSLLKLESAGLSPTVPLADAPGGGNPEMELNVHVTGAAVVVVTAIVGHVCSKFLRACVSEEGMPRDGEVRVEYGVYAWCDATGKESSRSEIAGVGVCTSVGNLGGRKIQWSSTFVHGSAHPRAALQPRARCMQYYGAEAEKHRRRWCGATEEVSQQYRNPEHRDVDPEG